MPNCCSARCASSLNGSTSWRIDLNLVAADGLELAQRGEQVEPRLHVGLGHVGADEVLDHHRVLGVQVLDQLAALRRQRTELFAGHVGPQPVVARQEDVQADDHGDQGQEPHRVVAGHRAAAAAPAPMAAADEHDAQVEHQGHDRQKVADAGKADHAAGKIVELLGDAQPLEKRRTCREPSRRTPTAR